MMAVERVAASGVSAAFARVGAAAERIASVGTTADLTDAAPLDLSTAALDLIAGRTDLAANAAVLRTAVTMTRLLDVRI